MNFDEYLKFIKSEIEVNNLHSDEEILNWIEELNYSIKVEINKCKLSNMKEWYYNKNEGSIKHISGKFFSVEGIYFNNKNYHLYQPIINQPEIGFLGIIIKEFNGIYYFLMQAKIEPGNINKVQISPTLQATKSNFLKIHNGKEPYYLNYFLNTKPKNVMFDSLQSEQGTKFLYKRNRNIIIKIEEEIKIHKNYRWLSLRQIKKLMNYDNLINMDTRTVISNIQFNLFNKKYSYENLNSIINLSKNNAFFYSMIETEKFLTPYNEIKYKINSLKMSSEKKLSKIKLHELPNWKFSDEKLVSVKNGNFEVIYCKIEIEDREVKHWSQPLFQSLSKENIVFLIKKFNNIYYFLCKLENEFGLFDSIEISSTFQNPENNFKSYDYVSEYILEKINTNKNILKSVLFSEEGGRFYHEQNRNIILEAEDDFNLNKVEKNYFWLTLGQLNHLISYDNFVNIQARNLTSIISMGEIL